MLTKKTKCAIAITLALTATLALVISIFAQNAEKAEETEELEYVGTKKCRPCHLKEYKSWEKTPHATNFELVKLTGRDAEAECRKCHTTAYNEETNEFLEENTGCEACHGPGSKHAAKGLKKEERKGLQGEVKKGTCEKCHMPHGGHPELGKEILPVLKKRMSDLQARIAEVEGK